MFNFLYIHNYQFFSSPKDLPILQHTAGTTPPHRLRAKTSSY